jgi:hypothetical protein
MGNAKSKTSTAVEPVTDISVVAEPVAVAAEPVAVAAEPVAVAAEPVAVVAEPVATIEETKPVDVTPVAVEESASTVGEDKPVEIAVATPAESIPSDTPILLEKPAKKNKHKNKSRRGHIAENRISLVKPVAFEVTEDTCFTPPSTTDVVVSEIPKMRQDTAVDDESLTYGVVQSCVADPPDDVVKTDT